jgi:hypothetical protein
LAVFLMASVSNAGITGSAHDFGAGANAAWSKGQICAPCHAPHNATVKDADGNQLNGPLWNHQLSAVTQYTLFNEYSDMSGFKTGKVDQNSKLCLSCHDGTVALDSFGGQTGSQVITNPRAVFSSDLSNDHPIGEAAVWPQTWDPTANGGKGAWTGGTYMVTPDLRNTAGIMPLRVMADGRNVVGCTSCHEPHNRKSQDHLLWVNNSGPATTVDGRAVSGSVLCMNCHKK